MKKETELDLHRLKERFGGRYVALLKGRVVASARTNGALLRKIRIPLRTKPIGIMYVPPKGVVCVYSLAA